MTQVVYGVLYHRKCKYGQNMYCFECNISEFSFINALQLYLPVLQPYVIAWLLFVVIEEQLSKGFNDYDSPLSVAV